MKKIALIFALVSASALGAQTLEDKAKKAIAKTEERQAGMMTQQMNKPFPPVGLWREEQFALGCYLNNKKLAEADAAMLKVRDIFAKKMPGDAHWNVYILRRIYSMYSSKSATPRMSKDAEKAIAEIMDMFLSSHYLTPEAITYDKVNTASSENHHMQHMVSLWDAAHLLAKVPEYKNKKYGDMSLPELTKRLDGFMKLFLRERGTKGLLVEVASPTYVKYTLNTLYNLYDFSEDVELKKLADMFLNVFYTDWAIEQFDGLRGGSMHRAYPGPASYMLRSSVGWPAFGLGNATNHPGYSCALNSTWRPNPLVAEIACMSPEKRGSYEFVSRRCGHMGKGKARPDFAGKNLLRYTYHTPGFIMGTSMVPPQSNKNPKQWAEISSQNRRNTILFNGKTKARIFTERARPKRGSVYNAEWGVQNKGVMMLQVLDKKYTTAVNGQSIFFSNTLKLIEKDSWIFVEAPDAYCAVKVLKGGYKIKKEIWRKRERGTYYVLNDIYSPIIFEASDKDKYNSFEDFQAEILANKLQQGANSLTYASKAYANELKLYTDYSKNPEVNGITVDFNPAYAYKSPYLNGKFGGSTVTISNGDNKVVYDFEMDKAKAAIAEIPKQFAMAKKHNNNIAAAKRKSLANKDATDITKFQKQFKADSATVTVADRGDGKAGYGSDIWMTEKVPGRGANAFSHLMLIREGDNCIGAVRFDLSLFKGMDIENATLKLFANAKAGAKINLFAMKDSDVEEFYEEKITWNTFPVFKKADGKFDQDCFNKDKVIRLTSFTIPANKQWLTVSNSKLTDFVKANKNNVVVFIIQSERGGSSSFGTSFKDGKKFKDAKNAPQLILTIKK